MSDLPKGWEITTLGEICSKPQYGWTSKAGKSGTVRYLRTTDISSGKIDWDTVPFCVEMPDVPEKYKVQKDDILVSRAGSVGISYKIKEVPFYAVFASYLIRFKPLDGIEPGFVENYLKSETYWRSISECTAGIAIPNVNASKLAELEIPLPPLPEQRRIVAKLEKLLHKVDASKERLDKIPAILKRFRQSVLAAACSGRLTEDWREKNSPHPSLRATLSQRERGTDVLPLPLGEGRGEGEGLPEGWKYVLSDKLFSFVTSGSRGWAKYYSDEGALFVRIGNLDHGSISLDLQSIQRVKPPKGAEGTRTRIQENDILISITADVGMIALTPPDVEEAYINQHIALARPVEGYSTKYLAWYLASSEGGLRQFQELQRGATKVGLGLDDIKNVWVPLPPLPEQQEIVRRVEALFKKADEIEARYKKAKGFVDRLTQSILAKAFRGELVPQDPNDEPAAVLLDRIKAERGKQEPKKRGRNK